ncbi:hypothetical protein EDB85DRAFT_2249882 [Lactarius pseudohatsudake]|nr:hypothetical protein EDB85DRAFT_2249882 [Lactarius pseudohatsudake]
MTATSATFRVARKHAQPFAVACDYRDQQGSMWPTVPIPDLAALTHVCEVSRRTEACTLVMLSLRSVTSTIALWFYKNETAQVLQRMKALNLGFSMEGFERELREYIVPEVVNAYLTADNEALKTYNVLWAMMEQYLCQGMQPDSKVLDIQQVDVSMGCFLEDNTPMFVITFTAQEVLLFRDCKTREVVVGAEDHIEQCNYAAVVTRVEEDLRNELTGGWKVIEQPEAVPVVSGANGPRPKLANTGKQVLNLTSYNFMGLTGNKVIKVHAIETLRKYGVGSCGPPGFYSTIDVYTNLERDIVDFLRTEASILYSQGFLKIPCMISASTKHGDIIIADQGINFTIQKGLQISRSTICWFDHNDLRSPKDVLPSVEKERRRCEPVIVRHRG